MPLATIDEALAELRAGRMIILVDDEDRENEGDLCLAADCVTADAINFMAREGRGMICLSLTVPKVAELSLPMQAEHNSSRFGTAFTVSIDAHDGVTTGISAADRAHTIRVAVRPGCRPEELARPGHVHPLRAVDGGVLVRAGQTEGSVDLARMAGFSPAGVICEIMNDDGSMARMGDLERFAARHGLKIVSVADLIQHRRRTEVLVERKASVRLPTEYAEFALYVYQAVYDRPPHLALCLGGIGEYDAHGRAPRQEQPVLTRVHSECLTGDIFASRRCDCGFQIHRSLELIAAAGRGVVLYMRQEGRGIGLMNKLKAYHLQDRDGIDTVEANRRLGFKPDLRDYGTGAQILRDLGLTRLRLLTNNPKKIVGLGAFGLEVVERVPIAAAPNKDNAGYLQAKRLKLGHLLDDPETTRGCS